MTPPAAREDPCNRNSGGVWWYSLQQRLKGSLWSMSHSSSCTMLHHSKRLQETASCNTLSCSLYHQPCRPSQWCCRSELSALRVGRRGMLAQDRMGTLHYDLWPRQLFPQPHLCGGAARQLQVLSGTAAAAAVAVLLLLLPVQCLFEWKRKYRMRCLCCRKFSA